MKKTSEVNLWYVMPSIGYHHAPSGCMRMRSRAAMAPAAMLLAINVSFYFIALLKNSQQNLLSVAYSKASTVQACKARARSVQMIACHEAAGISHIDLVALHCNLRH